MKDNSVLEKAYYFPMTNIVIGNFDASLFIFLRGYNEYTQETIICNNYRYQ